MTDANQNGNEMPYSEQAQIVGADLMQKIEIETAMKDTPPEQTSLSGIEMPNFTVFEPDIFHIEQDYNDFINEPPPLETGFPVLDKITGGLYNGVSVIGGSSGTGKTTIATQIAYNVASKGVKVLFLSLEMKRRHITIRNHAIHAKKYFDVFTDKEFYKKSVYPLQGSNISIKNQTTISFTGKHKTVENVIKLINGFYSKVKNENENNEILVIIDHLQHIRNKSLYSENSEYITLSNACDELTEIADEKDIKILLLSQLNRGAYDTVKEKGVQMQDFKGTGKIDNNAVLLLGISKTGKYGELKINVVKNRYGKDFDGFIYGDFNGIWIDNFTTSKEISDLTTNSGNKGGQSNAY